MSKKKAAAAVAKPTMLDEEDDVVDTSGEGGESDIDTEDLAPSGDMPAPGAGSKEGGEGDLVVLEDEYDFEEPEAEAESDEDRPPAKTKAESEGGGDSMLARYFREMASHPVMGQ